MILPFVFNSITHAETFRHAELITCHADLFVPLNLPSSCPSMVEMSTLHLFVPELQQICVEQARTFAYNAKCASI